MQNKGRTPNSASPDSAKALDFHFANCGIPESLITRFELCNPKRILFSNSRNSAKFGLPHKEIPFRKCGVFNHYTSSFSSRKSNEKPQTSCLPCTGHSKSIVIEQLLTDRCAQIQMDSRSRDLSNAFDSGAHSSRNTTKFSSCLTENKNKSTSRIIEQHFKSIYQNPRLLQDSSYLKEERQRLEILLGSNISKTAPKTKKFAFEEELGRLPMARLGLPVNRRQVEVLDTWQRNLIQELDKHSDISLHEKNTKKMMVIKFALMELTRQVAVQCLERGELLQRLVEDNTEMMEKGLQELQLKLKKTEKKYENQKQKLNAEILHLRGENTELQKQNMEAERLLNTKQESLDLLKTTKQRQQIQIDELKDDIKTLQERLSKKAPILVPHTYHEHLEPKPSLPEPPKLQLRQELKTRLLHGVLTTDPGVSLPRRKPSQRRSFGMSRIYQEIFNLTIQKPKKLFEEFGMQTDTIVNTPAKLDIEFPFSLSLTKNFLKINGTDFLIRKRVMRKKSQNIQESSQWSRKTSVIEGLPLFPQHEKSQEANPSQIERQKRDNFEIKEMDNIAKGTKELAQVSTLIQSDQESEQIARLTKDNHDLKSDHPLTKENKEFQEIERMTKENKEFQKVEILAKDNPQFKKIEMLSTVNEELKQTEMLTKNNEELKEAGVLTQDDKQISGIERPTQENQEMKKIEIMVNDNEELKELLYEQTLPLSLEKVQVKHKNSSQVIDYDTEEIIIEKERIINKLLEEIDELKTATKNFRPRSSLFLNGVHLEVPTDNIDLRKNKEEASSEITPTLQLLAKTNRGDCSRQPELGNDRGREIIENLKNFTPSERMGHTTSATVHKFISRVYKELYISLKDNLQSLDSPLHIKKSLVTYAYKLIVHNYGLSKGAESKFHHMMRGVIAYAPKNVRVKLFASFIGIFPCNKGDLEFYLKGLFFMNPPIQIKTPIINQESAEKQLVPLLKANEYITKYFGSRLRKEELIELKSKIAQTRVIDAKSSLEAVDVDEVLSVCLQKFRVLLGVTQAHVKDIFNASDLDNSNTIDLEEFMLLARCVEPMRLPEKEALKLFERLSDKERRGDDTIKTISFQSFAIGCVENNLFTEQAQNQFLGRPTLEGQTIAPGLLLDRLRLVEHRLRAVDLYEELYPKWGRPIEEVIQGESKQIRKALLIKLKLIEADSIFLFIEKSASKILGELDSLTLNLI